MIRRAAAVLFLLWLTPPVLAQSSISSTGVLPTDRAIWFLLQVGGEPPQDIDIDVHFTVSGPAEGRILDLDQYAKLEGAFEAKAASVSGVLDLSLSLPAREYGRWVAVELRHAAAGAPGLDFEMTAGIPVGVLRLVESKEVPMAGFGKIHLFNRMVLFDAAYVAENDGKAFTIGVMTRMSHPVPARFGMILQMKNIPEFVVTEEYGWRKKLKLFRAQIAPPGGELRVTVPLAAGGDAMGELIHKIFVPCPSADPAAAYRGEMVFSVEMFWPIKSPFETSGSCDAVVVHVRNWTRLGPLAALAATCALAAGYLRRISRVHQVTWGTA